MYKTAANGGRLPALPRAQQGLTFDTHVAVSLEVVVGGFPGVAVVTEQRDRRPGAHRHVSYTFLIYKRMQSCTEWKQAGIHNSSSSTAVSATSHKLCVEKAHFPWYFPSPIQMWWGLLFVFRKWECDREPSLRNNRRENTDPWVRTMISDMSLPMYSFGGDFRFSAFTSKLLAVDFSSSVLFVSIMSPSSVEMTCCCLRGFFLGEAPGGKSLGGMERLLASSAKDGDTVLVVKGGTAERKEREEPKPSAVGRCIVWTLPPTTAPVSAHCKDMMCTNRPDIKLAGTIRTSLKAEVFNVSYT